MDAMRISWLLIGVIEAANKAKYCLQQTGDADAGSMARYWLEQLDAEMRQVERTLHVD